MSGKTLPAGHVIGSKRHKMIKLCRLQKITIRQSGFIFK